MNEKLSDDPQSVRAASVNMLTDDTQLIKAIYDAFQPAVESMEGAAFHYVCLMKGLPFLQIRGISNLVGVRDKSKWKTKEALSAATELLIQEYHALLNQK
jgi:futalosine hydrolase